MSQKNERREKLTRILAESVQQYNLMLKNHELHVEKFDELRKIRIESTKKSFLGDCELLFREFEEEYSAIVDD